MLALSRPYAIDSTNTCHAEHGRAQTLVSAQKLHRISSTPDPKRVSEMHAGAGFIALRLAAAARPWPVGRNGVLSKIQRCGHVVCGWLNRPSIAFLVIAHCVNHCQGGRHERVSDLELAQRALHPAWHQLLIQFVETPWALKCIDLRGVRRSRFAQFRTSLNHRSPGARQFGRRRRWRRGCQQHGPQLLQFLIPGLVFFGVQRGENKQLAKEVRCPLRSPVRCDALPLTCRPCRIRLASLCAGSGSCSCPRGSFECLPSGGPLVDR